jgi:hypothetical protein
VLEDPFRWNGDPFGGHVVPAVQENDRAAVGRGSPPGTQQRSRTRRGVDRRSTLRLRQGRRADLVSARRRAQPARRKRGSPELPQGITAPSGDLPAALADTHCSVLITSPTLTAPSGASSWRGARPMCRSSEGYPDEQETRFSGRRRDPRCSLIYRAGDVFLDKQHQRILRGLRRRRHGRLRLASKLLRHLHSPIGEPPWQLQWPLGHRRQHAVVDLRVLRQERLPLGSGNEQHVRRRVWLRLLRCSGR